MAGLFWIHHQHKSGGRSSDEQIGPLITECKVEIVTMREYVKCWRAGYGVTWIPPEWIQDIFPVEQK